jgi:O-antigen ligase
MTSATALPLHAPARHAERADHVAASWARFMLACFVPLWLTAAVLDFRVTLTIVTLGAFVATIAGLRHPVIGLYGLGMVCTLDGMSTPLLLHGGLWRWNTPNYWLLIVAVLFVPLLIRRREPQFWWLIALFIWLGIGLIWSHDRPNGVQHIFAAFATLGMLVYFARARRVPGAWYWLAVICSVTGACASLMFLLARSRLPELNENIWSHVPLMALFAVALAFGAGRLSPRRQLQLSLLAAINLAAVFISGSRGNLAMVLVTVLAVALLTPGLSRKAMVLVGIGVVGVGVITQFPQLGERMLHRLQIMTNTEETPRRRTSGRFELAVGGWYLFREHPIAGIGTGGFPKAWAAFGHREGLADFQIGKQMAAHSGWIKVMAESGLPGLLLMAGFVASFCISGWRRRRWRTLVLGSMASATMAFGFLSTEFQSKSLWFLAAGAMVLLVPQHRRHRVRAHDDQVAGAPA